MRRLLLLCLIASFGQASCQVFEAEAGVRTGTQIATARAGYSGVGYVTGFDADNDKVSISIESSPGVYELYIRYASPSGDKWNFVQINGQNLGSIKFPSSSSFQETLVGKVWLTEGINVLEIIKHWGYFDVDNVRFEPSLSYNFNQVVDALVTPAPSKRADSLYRFLRKTYGKVVLSGQYGGATEFQRIKNLTGKTPVVRGFDLMDYTPSRVEHGTTSTEVEKAIEWDQQRGVTTFCWHWNAPKNLIDQPGKEWWRGFYTEATTFDVSIAMNDPLSEEYTLLVRDIDAIAIQLKRLKAAGIPVLWRPLHEAEGKWFWWGAKGAEPCKWLWKLLFNRLVNEHELDNLIWVWTSTGDADAVSWYPGDEYVDMIGADIYLPARNYSSSFVLFDNMATIYSGHKMIAMSENGTLPDAQSMFEEYASWSFFATWGGDFITDGQTNDELHIVNTFTHEYVITLDEIDRIDDIISSVEKKREAVTPPVVTAVDKAADRVWIENPILGPTMVVHGSGIRSAALFDLQGRKIIERSSEDSGPQIMELDCASLPGGIYIARVTTPFAMITFRVLTR
jgi:mannan endo-1,4-beta-mannosidase